MDNNEIFFLSSYNDNNYYKLISNDNEYNNILLKDDFITCNYKNDNFSIFENKLNLTDDISIHNNSIYNSINTNIKIEDIKNITKTRIKSTNNSSTKKLINSNDNSEVPDQLSEIHSYLVNKRKLQRKKKKSN